MPDKSQRLNVVLKFIKEREIREKVEKVKEMGKKHLQPTQENTEEERR